ncbi:MAG TPA: hypothetical protein VK988_11130, partial [Acidimicrobiales bacterium]|nr:hypothetical protein [Acidimicrobiales bacterium]
MAVKVARGVLSRIRSYPDNIVIQVQGASDPEAAAAALARAGKEIANLDAGWRSAPNLGPTDRNNPQYVSPVLPTGTGPFIQVDGGHVPYQTLRAIPDIVVRHLVEAGVAEATVASPKEGGPLTEMFASGRGPSPAVVLRLFPPPPLRWRQV